MLEIRDIKPKIKVIRNISAGVFGANLTSYNENGYSYNQAGNTYGGADRISDIGPALIKIENIKPKLKIINL